MISLEVFKLNKSYANAFYHASDPRSKLSNFAGIGIPAPLSVFGIYNQSGYNDIRDAVKPKLIFSHVACRKKTGYCILGPIDKVKVDSGHNMCLSDASY